jgi:hypothetical protein
MLHFKGPLSAKIMSEAKSIFIYLYASSPDAAAWMLKFVFAYLANTVGLCYSLTIICCCQVQDFEHAHCLETINNMWFLGKRESGNAWKKADFDGFIE